MTADSTAIIVHELPRRFRVRSQVLRHRNVDSAYLQALLENITGVSRARVNIYACSVIVEHDGTDTVKSTVLSLLQTPPGELFSHFDATEKPMNPVTLGAIGFATFGLRFLPQPMQSVISFAIALPTLLKGIDTLLNRGVKVEVLDAGAVGFSLLRHDFFTANMIVFLLGVGERLEQLSEDKTTGLLKALLRPQVEEVWRIEDEVEVKIPIERLQPGDVIRCGPGELIPIDGVVVDGDALLNQSSITGESVPVHKQNGDSVLSGTLVEEGKLAIKVETVGNDTGMARISRFLENSLRSSSESQTHSAELADRLVPITLALGVGIFLTTRDFRRATGALTVDFSCAIKLAAPIAVKTAMYSAAHNGALVKGAQAFDELSKVDTLVFDKTGTLTQGALQVTDIKPIRRMRQNDLLSLAAGAEELYEHPVAKAVVDAARQRNLTFPVTSQVDFIVAHGVSAYVDGKQVLAGSRHFVEEDEGIDCSAANRYVDKYYEEGKNVLYITRSGKLIGVIALRDQIRPEAERVLARLKNQGVKKIVVLTGDHQKTALALKNQLPDIDEVHWDLKPEQKADVIARLKSQGAYTAFIGDGVNDAPALVTADVGISLPSGADLAKDAAQALLLHEDLDILADTMMLAQRTRKTISNSFYATIGFNSLFLLLAVSGRIQPVTSALLHNLNTVGILGYSAYRGLSAKNDLIATKEEVLP